MELKDFGFASDYWHGLKTITDLNGDQHQYRDVTVDVIDLHTRKKVGRMPMGAVLVKFN